MRRDSEKEKRKTNVERNRQKLREIDTLINRDIKIRERQTVIQSDILYIRQVDTGGKQST